MGGMKTRIQRGLILWLACIGVLAYQNCAPRGDAPSVPHATQSELQREAVQSLKDLATPEVCDRDSSYLCEERTYSAQEKDANAQGRSCYPSVGGEVCVETLKLGFNTAEQIKNCRSSENESGVCTAQEIVERYDHREIKCMNHLAPAGRSLPIAAEGASVPEALAAVKQKCRELLGEQGQ